MLISSQLPRFIGANFYQKPKTYLHEDAIFTCGVGFYDGQQGVFSREGHLITAAAFFHRFIAETKGNPISIDPLVAKNFPEIEEAFYAGHFHDQYGHFITEFIPRIWAYKQYNLKTPILVRTANSTLDSLFNLNWVQDLIDLLGFKRSDFISPATPIKIKNLTIPDPLYAEQSYCYKHMADFCHTIGDKAISTLAETSLIKNSNIYLSRSHLICGTILVDNEKALEEKLKEFGFIVIHPQELLVREQIALFRNNNIVVGTLGSAFHTSIFSPSPQGVAINMREYPETNYLVMDGVNNASIDYITHSDIFSSPQPNGNYIETKRLRNPEKVAQDIYDFVMEKRQRFAIANMGKNAVAYKPDITFHQIKCKQDNQEKIVRVDSRNGSVTTEEGDLFNDLLLVCLKTNNQATQNFLIVNSDTPSVIKQDNITAPMLPIDIHKNENQIALHIMNTEQYFVVSNNTNFETYILSEFNYETENKNGLKILSSILSSLLDNNSHSNMEYYNNIYPELINSFFEMKNSLRRHTKLTYGSHTPGFLPLTNTKPPKNITGRIITHRSNVGDMITKGNLDVGQSYIYPIEAITINLDQKSKEYRLQYSVHIKDGEWTNWVNENEIAGTTGQGRTLTGFSAKVFDKHQNEVPCICYAKFENDDQIHAYSGGILFSSPDQQKLICFAVYIE